MTTAVNKTPANGNGGAPQTAENGDEFQDVFQRTPAFQLNRFKGVIYFVVNDSMADVLLEILNKTTVKVERWTYAFRQKLDQKLYGRQDDQDERASA